MFSYFVLWPLLIFFWPKWGWPNVPSHKYTIIHYQLVRSFYSSAVYSGIYIHTCTSFKKIEFKVKKTVDGTSFLAVTMHVKMSRNLLDVSTVMSPGSSRLILFIYHIYKRVQSCLHPQELASLIIKICPRLGERKAQSRFFNSPGLQL